MKKTQTMGASKVRSRPKQGGMELGEEVQLKEVANP